MKKIITLLFLFSITIVCFSQQRLIDSLKVVLQDESLADIDKILPLSQLSGLIQGDSVASLMYSRQAVDLALKQQDASYGVYSYSNLGLIYALKGNILRTYSIIDSCMWYINNSTDIRANAIGLNRIGVMKIQLEDKDGVSDIYKSLEVLNGSVDNWDTQAVNYYSLSNYYNSDIPKSDMYSRLSLECALKSQKPNVVCLGWSIRGVRYLVDPKVANTISLQDSAIYNFEKAIEVCKRNPGYIRDIVYLNLLVNTAYTYQLKNELHPDKANVVAIDNCVKEANLIAANNHDIEFLVNYYQLLILAELTKKDYISAEKVFLEAISTIDNYDNLFRVKFELYYQLSLLYKELNKFEKSTEYLEKSLGFYQKYYDEKNIKIGQQQHAKYELAKKEQEILFGKKQNQLYAGLIICLVLSLLFLLFFFIYRIKYYEEKKKLLQQEKEEADLLLRLKDEENKVLEIAKQNIELEIELRKEEANKLQKETLAKNIQIDHKNKILEELQEIFSEKHDSYFINRIIKTENVLDRNFDDFVKVLNEIHPEFYNKLQEKAKQKLTVLDLKYCVYIYMKMPSKEMADLLHVELKTVRMTRYRLKQKFGLAKDDDLASFIQCII
jgi:tetratricopeptide (TPR) repeat protein/DNA-binding CsgD family transcriptional regulator